MKRLILAAFLALAPGVETLAAGPLDLTVEYSAESIVGAGDNARAGKLWRTSQALRHDTTEQGQAQTVILRLDRSVAWLAFPAMQTVIETDVAAFGGLVAALRGTGQGSPSPVGTETVDGMRATKYRIAVNDPTAGRFDGFVWSTAQGVVLKIEGDGERAGRQGKVSLQFRNIRIGPQEASLFEPPPALRRVKATPEQLETMIRGLEQLQKMMSGAR